MAVTILIRNITEVPNEIDADESGGADPHGIKLISAFSDMPENPWL
jgi:hypothetical protein